MWKYETLGTVEMGEQNQSVTVAAVSTVLDMPIVGFLDTSYFGEYRSPRRDQHGRLWYRFLALCD